jgi:hypothetical protein
LLEVHKDLEFPWVMVVNMLVIDDEPFDYKIFMNNILNYQGYRLLFNNNPRTT